MSKEQILKRVAEAREKNPQQGVPSHYMDIMKGEDDLLALYKRNQLANKAIILETSPHELQATLEKLLAEQGVSRLLCSPSLPISLGDQVGNTSVRLYDAAREEMGDAIFASDCAILEANVGVANLGIVNVVSSATTPRLLSLTTDKVIFLLKKDRIVRSVPQAIAQVKETYKDVLPTNILFIAGPSRTADIEFQVVFGVHGPREVFVVLY